MWHNFPLSDWYPCNTGKLRQDLMVHLHLEPIKMGMVSQGRACQYSHSKNCQAWCSCLCWCYFATAWVMVSTRNFGSRSWLNFWFWASRLLICLACLLIQFCLCQEFLDNLSFPASSEITHEETSTDDVWEPVFSQSTPTTKCHSQTAQKWHKALHTIRCLKSTVSNCHVVWISQFMSILIFKLLIGINSKFWFPCYFFWTRTCGSFANMSSDSFSFWAQP